MLIFFGPKILYYVSIFACRQPQFTRLSSSVGILISAHICWLWVVGALNSKNTGWITGEVGLAMYCRNGALIELFWLYERRNNCPLEIDVWMTMKTDLLWNSAGIVTNQAKQCSEHAVELTTVKSILYGFEFWRLFLKATFIVHNSG